MGLGRDQSPGQVSGIGAQPLIIIRVVLFQVNSTGRRGVCCLPVDVLSWTVTGSLLGAACVAGYVRSAGVQDAQENRSRTEAITDDCRSRTKTPEAQLK